jgi:uncharacterized protein (DUF169 family)
VSELTDEIEQKNCLSTKLKNTLALNGNPVAIAIVSELPQGLKKWQSRATICTMIQIARKSVPFYCQGENVICTGKAHVGIGNIPSWDMEDFLTRREKLVGSRAAARRMLDLALEQTSKLGKYIVLSPLEKANFRPDVVLFIGTPFQISRILFLDAFETGEVSTLHREPLCSGVIAAPITTGQIGLSLLDMACRSFGQYQPEEMVIGVPYHRIPRIVNSINHSVAGNAKSNFLIKLLPKIISSKEPE